MTKLLLWIGSLAFLLILAFYGYGIQKMRKGKSFVYEILNSYMFGIENKAEVEVIEKWMFEKGVPTNDDLFIEIKMIYRDWNRATRHTSHLGHPDTMRAMSPPTAGGFSLTARAEYVLSLYAVVYRHHINTGLLDNLWARPRRGGNAARPILTEAGKNRVKKQMLVVVGLVDSVIEKSPSHF